MLAPSAQIGYATQLVRVPPVQPLPGAWGTAQPQPSKALQPVSHALSPAIAKPCGEGTCGVLARAGSSCDFLRPQESREAWLRLPASRSNISGKGELRPRPPGLLSLAAELPPPGSRSGCGMQRLGQPHLARNSSPHCNPGSGVLAIPGGVTSQLPFWGS